jgi:nitric oxide reductase subunit C
VLSKSQARAFFLGGTGLFGAIFLALTVDSMRQIPALTNEDKLSDEVVRGKAIWEDNNCMGCHTLFGEGAYYAPELTKVVERRGAAWIRLFIKDPQKMFPGQRKMVQYNFTDSEISDVIAFLDWCGKVNLQGFPAKPPLQALMRPTSTTASAGPPQPELFRTICVACHAVGGVGGVVGPPLDEVHKRKTREEMVTWISDPQRLKPGTPMPKIDMTPEQLNEVVDYLLSLAGTASTPRAQTPTAAPVDPKDFE